MVKIAVLRGIDDQRVRVSDGEVKREKTSNDSGCRQCYQKPWPELPVPGLLCGAFNVADFLTQNALLRDQWGSINRVATLRSITGLSTVVKRMSNFSKP